MHVARIVVCSVLATLGLASLSTAHLPADPFRVQGWLRDLDVLESTIKEKHCNAFTKLSREQFTAAVAKVREQIPTLQDHQILIEFLRLTALLGDGHTMVQPGQGAQQFHSLPLGLVWTKEGLFIAAATEEHQQLLRQQIVGIGKATLDEALAKVALLQAAENESARRDSARRWLTRIEALHALGIIDDVEIVPVRIQDGEGTQQTARLKALPVTGGLGGPKIVYAVDPQSKEMAISRRQRRDRYGFELLPDKKTLYCWYDSCQDLPNRPVAAWCKEVLAEIDTQSPERVVLDLRRNGGGNSGLAQPLINGLSQRAAINQHGKLFVLIGPGTYSSAMMNALELRKRTKAVLIGLPTGGSPNAFGEIKFIALPHSKWQVQYSTRFFKQTNDGATTVAPDLRIEPTAADYFAGRDPVLEAALRFVAN